MFHQIFLSPQVKRWAIITYKHSIYELPHELPNDLRLIASIFQFCYLKHSSKGIYWFCRIYAYMFVNITQPTRNVPGTSPEGLLKVLTSGTSRGPPGDSHGTNTKIDGLMKKLFF